MASQTFAAAQGQHSVFWDYEVMLFEKRIDISALKITCLIMRLQVGKVRRQGLPSDLAITAYGMM